METIDLYQYEHELEEKGINYIGGVDEVGRGPLIGPVVTACCVLPSDFKLDGLTDSKKLSEKKREEYYEYIVNHCIAYGIGSASPERIDEINIYQATKEAMVEAIHKVQEQVPLEHVLIDAMPLELDIPHTSIIKGDAKSISIAAASVLAKVTRDRMLIELDKKYPEYGFANHKGYPTKKHIEAIRRYGLIDGYRRTYGPISEYLGLNYLDLLDERGKSTGETIEEQELIKQGGNVGMIHLWIINEKKEILLTHDLHSKLWDVPIRGYIKTKESKLKTVIRRGKEKLGITITTKDLKKHFISTMKENKIQCFLDIYLLFTENKVEDFIINKEEIIELKYVSLNQFIKMKEAKEIRDYNYFPELIKKIEEEEHERLFN